jgi:futalosine hydrolase
MRILLVAATDGEVASIVRMSVGATDNDVRLTQHPFARHDLNVLVTGVGMVATAAWCSRALAERRYGLALNVGVCGSFDRNLALGQVVHVVSDRIAELGAEDGDDFLPIEKLNLAESGDAPYTRTDLVNSSPPANAGLLALPDVTGVTVNTVHGNDRSIADIRERFHPQVETMEGAAFMYACMIRGVPFAQVRAVSNFVERRNRSAWRMADAIANLASATLRILEAA